MNPFCFRGLLSGPCVCCGYTEHGTAKMSARCSNICLQIMLCFVFAGGGNSVMLNVFKQRHAVALSSIDVCIYCCCAGTMGFTTAVTSCIPLVRDMLC
ncbi:unnamed protein product [Triticum turgidum subsp. durum]|uniref:Uncharacterized protein n=1 Tax=Triticum turgidum subsp. durum TaxID=4567 RepID=A0A9R0XUM8_TRITD|nr:unnamed protein product [Triticum turgidum subsp. durum]